MIALFQSKTLVGRLIRWQSFSDYSHVGWLYENGSVTEAWHKGQSSSAWSVLKNGVYRNNSLRTIHPGGTVVHIYDIEGIDAAQRFMIGRRCDKRIGKRYDFFAVSRFITRFRHQTAFDRERWFCSELVFDACQYADVHLLERIDAHRVTPGDISYSPLLNWVGEIVVSDDEEKTLCDTRMLIENYRKSA